MKIYHKISDIYHMAKDFYRIISGTDYFHRPDLIGRYFIDSKSYFTDFTEKANWLGDMSENIPLLSIPSLSKKYSHPGMILQYGLGNMEMYFLTGDMNYKENVRAVAKWLYTHIERDGSFNNLMQELNSDKNVKYFSNNSAMTQGIALSFLIRTLKYGLLEQSQYDFRYLIERIYQNLKHPIEHGGGTFYINDEVYLCEYCRQDEYIVLNGWIFAIFGLYDYCMEFEDFDAKEYLRNTINTLASCINSFIVPDSNWSYYDNKKRICSPPYHLTSINQVDILSRLTGHKVFCDAHDKLLKGNSWCNQVKYTLKKIHEKLNDTQRYTN